MGRAWRTVLGLLALSAAPLITLWKTLSERRPGLALLFAVAWLFVVAVGWLCWRVAAEPVDRYLGLLSKALDRFVEQRLSRYGALYRQWVQDSKRYLDAKGLATVGTFSPEIEEVFVDLGLASRAPQHVPPDLLGSRAPDSEHRLSLWNFLDQDVPVVLAVLGAPGSGKTTLLNHAARRTARTFRERRRSVPVLLQLRDHAKAVIADPEITLPDLIRRAIPKLPVGEPAGWWDNRLVRGRCIVMLDGLDEVASAAERRDILTWVDTQISVYPRNDFVVTSRPHGYRDNFIRSATTLQVLAFNLDQVRRFLHGWYLAVERRATASAGREVEMMAAEAADDLLDRLASSPALYDLTINPLLLTMIANVHRFRRSLPNSRADLYGEVCQVMLWRRQEAKRLDLNLSGVSKERLLAALAFAMMSDGTSDIARRQFLADIASLLSRVSAEITPDEFIADVSSNGLLVERERDRFSFAHHTFQEYLAARYIHEHGLERILVEAVDNSWWHETTLLYVAGTDADQIVRAALGSGSAAALSLAFECSELGAELAPELRRQLAEVLESAFEDDSDGASRRLVAGILASRHLRRLVPTPTGTRVCPEPVPGNLYWLFLKDTGMAPPDGPCSSDPHRDQPIRGMWSRDAAAFVRWLNTVVSVAGTSTRQTEGILYRLPTGEELTGLSEMPGPTAQVLRSRAYRVWCLAGNDAVPVVWTLPGIVPGNVVGAAELRETALADLRRSTVLGALLIRAAGRAIGRLSTTGGPVWQTSKSLAAILESARSGHRAGDLERDMMQALEIVRDLLSHLRQARSAAVTLDRALHNLDILDAGTAHALDRAMTAYPIHRALSLLQRASSLERDIAVTLDWNRDLDVSAAANAAQAIARRLDAAHERLRMIPERPSGPPARTGLERQIALDLPAGSAREAQILRTAVSAVLQPKIAEDSRSAVDRFGSALLQAVVPADTAAISVDLDRVAWQVRHLISAEPVPPSWGAEVTRRLVATAQPILDRRRLLTQADAQAIRVPALVLAGEAEISGQPRRATALRELAAAMCLMSHRASDATLLETLLIAST